MQHDNPDDKNLKFWQAYVKTVKPMPWHKVHKSKALEESKPLIPNADLEIKISLSIPAENIRNNKIIPHKHAGLSTQINEKNHFKAEKNAKKRMKKGDFIFDAKIDLHGQTQAQAFDNLHKFITKNYLSNTRHLLVITGRGRYCYQTLSPLGVLIYKVPEWLKNPPFSQMISVIETAANVDGGNGALYVILRKNEQSL
jgi:DNA-nicking Smr family endonuclease